MSSKGDAEARPPETFSFDVSSINLGSSAPVSVTTDLRKASLAAGEVQSELERSEFMRSGRLLSSKRASLMSSMRAAAAAQGAFSMAEEGSGGNVKGGGSEKTVAAESAAASAGGGTAAPTTASAVVDRNVLDEIRDVAYSKALKQRASSLNLKNLSKGKSGALATSDASTQPSFSSATAAALGGKSSQRVEGKGTRRNETERDGASRAPSRARVRRFTPPRAQATSPKLTPTTYPDK